MNTFNEPLHHNGNTVHDIEAAKRVIREHCGEHYREVEKMVFGDE